MKGCIVPKLYDRLAAYEDILFDSDGRELVALDQLKNLAAPLSDEPLTLEELQQVSADKPILVWTVFLNEDGTLSDDGEWQLFDGLWFFNETTDFLDHYGSRFVAFRRKPEEGTK